MRKAKSLVQKKRGGGRPTAGEATDSVTAIRLGAELRAAVDKWAAGESDKPSRSEAIRRLVELGLAGSPSMGRRSPKAASKASELAGQQIDKLADSSATDEERHRRKRRLLKGPAEFREIRGDLAKPKR